MRGARRFFAHPSPARCYDIPNRIESGGHQTGSNKNIHPAIFTMKPGDVFVIGGLKPIIPINFPSESPNQIRIKGVGRNFNVNSHAVSDPPIVYQIMM